MASRAPRGRERSQTAFKFILTIALPLAFAAQAPADPPNKPRKILFLSAESNIFYTGGLGHATAGLAKALNEEGIQADVMMPYYSDIKPEVKDQISSKATTYTVGLDFQNGVVPRRTSMFSLHERDADGFRMFFLKHKPHPGQSDYFDNPRGPGQKPYYSSSPRTEMEAFGAFDKAALQFIQENHYDYVILNDWPAGYIMPFIKMLRERGLKTPATIGAVHNLTYQGRWSPDLLNLLGIDPKYFNADDLEFHGDLSAMKGLLGMTDIAYTVSPNYAHEMGTRRFGQGYEGLVQKRTREGRFMGVLNGITSEDWDPAHPKDPALKYAFTADELAKKDNGKARGKAMLQERFKLPIKKDTPIIEMTSRITNTKGYNYLVAVIDQLARRNDVQIIVVADGEPRYVQKLQRLVARYPDKVRYRPFSATRERLVTAYSDFFMNTPESEPSGLNQFFAMQEGTVPILGDVGGLHNAVKDGKTGFLAEIRTKADTATIDNKATARSVIDATERALKAYRDKPEKILEMRQNGMRERNDWRQRATEFTAMFDYIDERGWEAIRKQGAGLDLAGKTPSQILRISRELRGRERCAGALAETLQKML